MILHVALDAPLRQTFDYLPPAEPPGATLRPGVRIWVPFGRRQLLGILVGLSDESPIPRHKLKAVTQVLDAAPVFDAVTFDLLLWAAEYYHHPIGEVFAAALPASLREGQPVERPTEYWQLTAAGRLELDHPGRRAPRRQALLAWLAEHGPATGAQILALFDAPLLRALRARGFAAAAPETTPAAALEVGPSEVELTPEQAAVVAAVARSRGSFAPHVVYGVTGSGKTEVYLRVIAEAVAQGGQALVLVPEIALTPQLVDRFRRRFSSGVEVLHSGLTGNERRDAWRAAHAGHARILIGTRSAVFASMPELKLIVVDEEHDASYKQTEGLRYSARDLAVMRAQRARLPILLGSATPSLETLENAAQGRYAKHRLPQRPGCARPPHLALVDLRRHAADQGLSQPVLQAMADHLAAGGQVIVFLNRRGFAPTLFCNACGWVAPCGHCDARMTLHRRAGEMRCHHCGAREAVPQACGACGQPLSPVGQGTERVEDTLVRRFPDAPLARLDRDTAGARGALEALLDRAHSGAARILVGTQMLAKGHHFPEVTLVVVLDADQGLFASDYRATERLAQTITQVAGRAGREARAGEVLIQTQFPDHPLLQRLIKDGYEGFAEDALRERFEADWPPYSRLALLRAEARDGARLDEFLRAAARCAPDTSPVKVQGPAAALMARRADHFRAHLLLESTSRSELQRFLARWLPRIDALNAPAGLRWSIDVDPLEVD